MPRRPAHQPSNAEIQQSFDRHAKEDRQFQDETRQTNGELLSFKAETEGKLEEIHKALEGVATKEDIGRIVSAAITDYFEQKGRISFKFIVATSILVGALTVIFGGFKIALGWIGFSLTK